LKAALAGLWASVLNVNQVGPDDDFFILGGDSLSGARLLAGVKSVFGIDLSLHALFHNAGTVAGMARAIEAERELHL
jgi:acyl carrier protein